MSSTEERFLNLLQDIKPNAKALGRTARMTEIGLDSFEYLRLVASVEQTFGIYFTEEDLMNQQLLETIQDFLQLIENKQACCNNGA
ncbi:acyl carrier protein [Cohnella laeviribosi]|uniref:acyl carrier protein n=1 Tax=Cohnella laeviribosi TaxID=380174 RepID=UPI0003705418|nr:acyl carrier protein [Cohnella laeviribosi]